MDKGNQPHESEHPVNSDRISVVIATPTGSKQPVLALLREELDVVAVVDGLDALVDHVQELVPDVVLIDDSLGRTQLAGAIAAVKAKSPASRVVVATSLDDSVTYGFVRSGAFCILHTNSTPTTVLTTLKGCARGEAVVSPYVAVCVGNELHSLQVEAGPNPPYRPPSLTGTEAEVLTQLGKGRSSESIGEEHDVTARLVNLHTGYAIAKLHNHLDRERILLPSTAL